MSQIEVIEQIISIDGGRKIKLKVTYDPNKMPKHNPRDRLRPARMPTMIEFAEYRGVLEFSNVIIDSAANNLMVKPAHLFTTDAGVIGYVKRVAGSLSDALWSVNRQLAKELQYVSEYYGKVE